MYFSLSITSGAEREREKVNGQWWVDHWISLRKKKNTDPCSQRCLLALEPCHPRVYRRPDPSRIFGRDRDRLVECFLVYSLDRRSLVCADAPDRIISNQEGKRVRKCRRKKKTNTHGEYWEINRKHGENPVIPLLSKIVPALFRSPCSKCGIWGRHRS